MHYAVGMMRLSRERQDMDESKKERRVYAVAVRPDLYRIICEEAKAREISRAAFVRLAVRTLLAPETPKLETRNDMD